MCTWNLTKSMDRLGCPTKKVFVVRKIHALVSKFKKNFFQTTKQSREKIPHMMVLHERQMKSGLDLQSEMSLLVNKKRKNFKGNVIECKAS